MNDSAPNATARTSQSQGERRNANGAGSAVYVRLNWSPTEFEEGAAESWRLISLAVSAGAAEGAATVRSLLTTGEGLGAKG